MKTTLAALTIGLTFSAAVGLAAEPPAGASLRPWPAQYKIKPHETHRLTPADVVGPDGIVYPNWTRCGVQGGIPEVKSFAAIEAYGGRANDDGDDAAALERACEAAGQSGGGTAYTGWDGCWDCLMENVETRKLRHAPLFQWAASGNVIRQSLFRESDGQWHAGWCNENLFELCRIESVADHGAYGFGLWASPPNDAAHGPNGPRNVVYNCDVTSPKAGLWMGGMKENWLILYNRFVVERGQGVYAGTTSFDHIIQGNVFALKDSQSPMLFLSRTNCVGVEVRNNRLYGGNGRIAAGPVQPLVMEGNQAFPQGDAPRPTPPVPSIYEWQQNQARASRR